MSVDNFVEVWIVRYMGYELDVCHTKYEAECSVNEIWRTIVSGNNSYWDKDDFDGFDANEQGTGFMNEITITSDWEV